MRDTTVDLLNELLEYDQETGDLLWKVRKATSSYSRLT